LILIIVISVGYWGVTSATQTIASFGHSSLQGIPGSMMSDNNLLALALVMVLPLLEYCREVSWNKIVCLICILGMILTIVAILGTYSRGGLIAFSAVLVSFWWRSKRHLLTIVLVISATAAIIFILPQKWNERMATIETAQSDESFRS